MTAARGWTQEKEDGSRRLLGRALDATQNGVMITDALAPDDPIVYVNRAFEEITGYASGEVLGRNPRFLQKGDSDQPALDDLRASRLGHDDDVEWSGTLRNYRKDGSLFYNELVAAAVRDEGGRATHHIGVVTDVTERVRAEERLRFQAELLEAVGQAVVAVDLSGRISYWNRAAEELYGWSSEEAVGRPVDEVMVSEEQMARAGEIWRELAARRAWSGEFVVRRRDGTPFPAAVTDTPVFDERGDLVGIIGVSADLTERKRAEEDLRESEANLARAQRLARLGSWEWDVRAGKMYWSDEAYRVLGFAPQEFEPTFERFSGAVHPDDRGMLEDGVEAALREGGPYDLEHRLLLPGGEVRVVHCRGEVAFGEGGEPLRTVGTVHDVTERKRAEEALGRIEERFRYMVRNSSDIITLVEADGSIRYVSPALERVLGYRPEERAGGSILDLLHPDDVEETRCLFAEGLERPGVPLKIEVRQRHKDGSWRSVEVTGTNLLSEPGAGAVVLNSRDATERKRAEEALRESERRFRQLFENSVDTHFVIHPETREIADCNREACRSLGYSREELLGMRLEDFAVEVLPEEEKRRRGPDTPWRRALVGEPATTIGFHENVHRRKDGTTFPVEVGVGSIDYAGRRMILASTRDATERKRAEEALRRSEARLAEAQRIAHVGDWEYAVGEDEGHWSDEVYRIFGRDPESFVPTYKTFLRSVHPDDRRNLPEAFRKALREGRTHHGHSLEFRVVRPDGGVRAVHARYEVVREDGAGRPARVVGTLQDVTERKALEERLAHQAFHDPLTGLANRALFVDLLEQTLSRAARGRECVAVLFLDLDDFKDVNDSFGHEAGDELLVRVSERLRGCVRPSDTVARFGGDEFVVLLEGLTGEDEALRIAGRVKESLRVPFALGGAGSEVPVTASIGVAFNGSGAKQKPGEVLREADVAMYAAKHGGKDRLEAFGEATGAPAPPDARKSRGQSPGGPSSEGSPR